MKRNFLRLVALDPDRLFEAKAVKSAFYRPPIDSGLLARPMSRLSAGNR